MSKNKASQCINAKAGKTHKKRKLSPIMIIIPSVLAIAIFAICVIVLAGKGVKANVVVTPDNVKDVIAEMKESEYTPIGSYEVTMNSKWTFANSSAVSSDAYVENCVNNRNTVYFTLTLDGSDEIIYTSPYIPVGSHMKNISLGTSLSAGTYNGVVKYHLMDDSYNDISTVNVAVKITIQH